MTTIVKKPPVSKAQTYQFDGDDYAHPLRAMAQFCTRHPELVVLAVDISEVDDVIVVTLTVENV